MVKVYYDDAVAKDALEEEKQLLWWAMVLGDMLMHKILRDTGHQS